MNEDVIQTQIKLIAFKAVRCDFRCELNLSKENSIQQKFDLQLSNLVFNDSPNHFAKVFKVELTIPSPDNSEFYFLNTEYHTLFECAEVNETFLESDFAKISAPAIGFPYLRSFISTLTIQAGIAPVILPSINFVQFSKDMDAKLMAEK